MRIPGKLWRGSGGFHRVAPARLPFHLPLPFASRLHAGAVDIIAAALLATIVAVPLWWQARPIPWHSWDRAASPTAPLIPAWAHVPPSGSPVRVWPVSHVLPDELYQILSQLNAVAPAALTANDVEDVTMARRDPRMERRFTAGNPRRERALRQALHKMCQGH